MGDFTWRTAVFLMVLAGGVLGSYSLSGEMYLREGESDDRVFFKENGNPCFRKLDYAIRLDTCEPVGSTAGSTDTFSSNISKYGHAVAERQKGCTGDAGGIPDHYQGRHSHQPVTLPGKDSHQIILSILSQQGGGKRRSFTLKRYQCCTIPETGHTVRLKEHFLHPSFPRGFSSENIVCLPGTMHGHT